MSEIAVHYKVSKYISAGATILNAWFLLPKKTLEIAEPASPDLGLVSNLTTGVSLIQLASTFTYQYNRYVKSSALTKWLIYGFIVVHLIALGLIIYLLLKQEKLKDKVSYGVSKIILPLLDVGLSIWHIIAMSIDSEDVTAYRILNTINGVLNLSEFAPIHEAIKTQPEIYYPVHGVRTLTKTAEGLVLIVETIEN